MRQPVISGLRKIRAILEVVPALMLSRLAAVIGVLLHATASAAADDAALWQALRSGGHIVVMRHAVAPGTGDPDHFRLGECSTQRNLSQDGRDQAKRIGARFRENGIGTARVYTSQWCRSSETARLLGLGEVSELPALNSFFGQAERGEAQTRALKQWLARQDTGPPLVLVTHQVNITALTGVHPASGEIVVIRRAGNGRFPVVGRLTP